MEQRVLLLLMFMTGLLLALPQPQQQQQLYDSDQQLNRKFHAVELNTSVISANLRRWRNDLAIMFYSSWSTQALDEAWEEIARLTQTKQQLVVGKFNCEQSMDSQDLCDSLYIDRYPYIMYIGYGNFNQPSYISESSIVGAGGANGISHGGRDKSTNEILFRRNPRIVRFVSDLYTLAIYDWVVAMTFVSTWQRRWSRFKNFLFMSDGDRNTAHREEISELNLQIASLERKVSLFSSELEKYKANELFDTLPNLGDPFPLLHSADPKDPEYDSLRACVSSLGAEYCKYNAGPEEPFCDYVDSCMKLNMEPEVCRPAVCPFKRKRGCLVVSTCMDGDNSEYRVTEAGAAVGQGVVDSSSAGGAYDDGYTVTDIYGDHDFSGAGLLDSGRKLPRLPS